MINSKFHDFLNIVIDFTVPTPKKYRKNTEKMSECEANCYLMHFYCLISVVLLYI